MLYEIHNGSSFNSRQNKEMELNTVNSGNISTKFSRYYGVWPTIRRWSTARPPHNPNSKPPKQMSATQTERKQYDDLTDKEKAFIDTYVRDTVSSDTETPMPVTVERALDLDMGDGNRISTKHADIIEERQDKLESGDLSEDDLFDADDLAADTRETEPTTPDAPDIDADDVDGPVIEYEGVTIPVEDLEEYWDERHISYQQLRQIAIAHDVRGDLGASDIIDRLKDVTGHAGDTEPDTAKSQHSRVSKPVDKKTYSDLTPLQQRVIDNWVNDPSQNKRDIEDASGASPGYSARTYRNYPHVHQPRRGAYKRGILTDEHLNTPEKDEFMDAEGNKLPTDEQPKGTPLEDILDAQGEDAPTFEELAALAEDPTEKTEPADEPVSDGEDDKEPTETDAPDELALGSGTLPQQANDIETIQETVQSLHETVEDIQTEVDDLRETVDEFDSDHIDSITQRLETIEAQVDQLRTSTSDEAIRETDKNTVALETSDWITVVRAMDQRLDRDAELGRDEYLERDEDIFNQLVAQIN